MNVAVSARRFSRILLVALYDICPKCKQSFVTCPHSVVDVAEFSLDNHIREIVRDELRKFAQESMF